MTDSTVPAVIENTLPAVAARPIVTSERTANVLAIISKGMESGATPEAMGQLVSLYERVMAKDAEAQFLEAKRAFQAECPVIGKNRTVDAEGRDGKRGPQYRFADLEKIVHTIRPLLEKHGFSYDFAQSYDKDIVTVTCFLRHAAGHVEATKFSGPWETRASMSAIQKSASATTFCQRYALRLALGLPVGEDDDAPPEPHENPDERTDTPKVPPRGQRQQQPTEPPANDVSQDDFTVITTEWKNVYGQEITDPKKGFAAFVEWAKRGDPNDQAWNPAKLAEWTTARYELAKQRLGIGGNS